MDTSPAYGAAHSPRNNEVRRQSFSATRPAQGDSASAVDLHTLTLKRTGASAATTPSAGTLAPLNSFVPGLACLPKDLSPVLLRFLTHLEAAGLVLTSRRIRDLVYADTIFGSIRTLAPHLANVAIVCDGQRNGMARGLLMAAEGAIKFNKSFQAQAWAPAVISLLAHGVMASQPGGLDHNAMLARCTAWEMQADGDAANLPEDEIMALLEKVSDNASTADFMREVLKSARQDNTTSAGNSDYLAPMLAELRKLVLESALDAISASVMAQSVQRTPPAGSSGRLR